MTVSSVPCKNGAEEGKAVPGINIWPLKAERTALAAV
jgi:hypothetical protein